MALWLRHPVITLGLFFKWNIPKLFEAKVVMPRMIGNIFHNLGITYFVTACPQIEW